MFTAMYKISLLAILILVVSNVAAQRQDYVIVIHGGAGNIQKEYLSVYDEISYYSLLSDILDIGAEMLENGATSVDVVAKVISLMEDSPLFNAGKGATFNRDGNNELEAAIMDGKTLAAGAVAGVTDIKNPILAAQKILSTSVHTFMVGNGASAYARLQGLKIVDNSYFFTFQRWTDFQSAKQREMEREKDLMKMKGTVGCVALDKYGNLAAGTSTGGLPMKRAGRVGDSPLIGIGTYANNKTCAVSCAGSGEAIIKNTVAYDISALIEYKGLTLDKATDYVVNTKMKQTGGDLGVIAIDRNGNISIKFNTSGMFRAYKNSNKQREVLIYGN
jgi:L-asparaginase / beta-aspartyl-peptidase